MHFGVTTKPIMLLHALSTPTFHIPSPPSYMPPKMFHSAKDLIHWPFPSCLMGDKPAGSRTVAPSISSRRTQAVGPEQKPGSTVQLAVELSSS